MRCWVFGIGGTVALCLNGCASMRTFEMADVQAQFTQSVQSAETAMQKAQTDFREKGALMDNLKKAGSAEFMESEAAMQGHFDKMRVALDEMAGLNKALRESGGQIASLTYAHPQIRSDMDEYSKVESAVATLQTTAQALNKAAADYSRESNSLADLTTRKKLYFNFDVQEFQKRVQQAVKAAQANGENMKRDLDRSTAILNNWNQERPREPAEEIHQAMLAGAQKHLNKAQQLADINKEINSLTMGSARISTLDQRWPAVQKLIDEVDRAILELKDLNERFLSDSERFRNPVKRVK